jgi:hypothetical protein
MSLSVDQLRREVGEHRDKMARIRRSKAKQEAEYAEKQQELNALRTGIQQLETAEHREREIIEAFEAAIALLTERLPDTMTLAPAVDAVVEAPTDESEGLPSERETAAAVERQRAAQKWVMERAQELDMGTVTELWLERAEWVAQILRETDAPLRAYLIARQLQELLDVEVFNTAEKMVSTVLPILVRQGRVRPRDDGGAYPAWEAVPAEKASAGIGVDVYAYAGTTSRWKRAEELAPGAHVKVETNAVEHGKKR